MGSAGRYTSLKCQKIWLGWLGRLLSSSGQQLANSQVMHLMKSVHPGSRRSSSLQADLDASRQQQDIMMDELSRVQSDLQHTQDLVQEQARSVDLLRSELEHARGELMREKELAIQQRQDMELLHAEALQQASEEIRQQATRYALLNDELISSGMRQLVNWQRYQQRMPTPSKI
jgi:single-stranded DNA-specific DHH superfamily exonuclease